jgi:protease-4
MKKFLLGILAGMILTALAGVIVVFSAIRLGEARPSVADGSTIVLNLDGGLPEKSPVSIPLPFIGTPTPLTVQEIWSGFRRAAADSRIKAVVLMVGNVDGGWAKLSQVREDILAFRKSGKPVYALLRSPRTRDYYLATAAERVYSGPEDMIDLKGLRAEVMYFKNALNKLGVEVQIQHVGKYKDAGDVFTETGMSPETRESLNLLLDGIYGNIVGSIATARKRNPDEIRAIMDDGPYTAQQAAAKGIVDALRFEDQVYGELKDRLKQGELTKISFRDYLRAIGPDTRAKHRIAFIVGEGGIARGSGSDSMGTDEGFTSGAFIRMLRSVASDRSISGVILRVDSPGGDAFASDEILREVKLLREKKPMVISMSDAAASGGYYVAMTGDPIVAYPATMTGSIGVFFGKLNLRGLYDKLGIRKEILTRGKNADIDSDYTPLTPEARDKLQKALEETYTTFVNKVAEGRKRKYAEVEPLAQGRVWLGMHAKERGLIDEVGGLDTAVSMIRKKAGISDQDSVRLVPYPPKRTLLEQWLKITSPNASLEKYLETLTGLKIRALLPGGVMRMMPYSVDVR